jgi:RNA polymerase sigma-70 factor (ECF subfamily)
MAAPGILRSAELEDEPLIQRVCEGDETAFEALYERYLPRVYQFVSRRVHNRADTEEIVQEVFVNIFSSIRTFRGDAPFAAWVLGLTRRTIANRFKKNRTITTSAASASRSSRPPRRAS